MATFKIKTKNQVDIDKKPRVYFTCHPDDFEKYFEKICEDIFNTHDCAIYYTENMREIIPEDEKELDLGRNNLFVVPVTLKLLDTANRAMDEDIPYAMKMHIPILPIMMDSGLDELYSKFDKFGELQYLNPYSADVTEITYEEKLKKYLEAVLISDEMAKRVRAAFDAYIFLSYRKKDRKYANELMRLIHSNPECRDIAIWFDEFLIPGESFKDTIEKILNDCKLFTLLVTPRLLEKVVDKEGNEIDNYVISTELPIALKNKIEKGIEIFAVEMEKTDKENLSAISIDDYVNSNDETFRSRLLETISKIATTCNNSPEHNFLIGLAYLEGIDVEVDRERGVELITFAANEGLPEAMEMLSKIYENGIGVSVNFQKLLYWKEKILCYCKQNYGENSPNTLASMNNLAVVYAALGQFNKALELQQKVYKLYCNVLGEEDPDTLVVLRMLANFHLRFGNKQEGLEINEKLYRLKSKGLRKDHPNIIEAAKEAWVRTYGDEEGAIEFVKKLDKSMSTKKEIERLTSLGELALAYGQTGDFEKALSLCENVYTQSCEILGRTHPKTIFFLNNLALAYSDAGDFKRGLELSKEACELSREILGNEHIDTISYLDSLSAIYIGLKDFHKALELEKEIYTSSCKAWGEEHPNTMDYLRGVAYVYGKLNEHKKELEIHKKVYEVRCKVLGEEHPDTLISLSDIALIYSYLGDEEKSQYITAIELGEKAYNLQCKVLGELHDDTLLSLNNLSFYYKVIGDFKRALPLYEKLYAQQMKVYGKDDPKTQKTIARLEDVRSKV